MNKNRKTLNNKASMQKNDDSFSMQRVIEGVCVLAIVALAAMFARFYHVPDSLKDINDRLNKMDDRLLSLEGRVSYLEGVYEIKSAQLNEPDEDIIFQESAIALSSNNDLGKIVKSITFEKNSDTEIQSVHISDNEIIYGIDSTEYEISSLQNRKFIMAYEEDGQQVFFCGQFNENNQWDNECLINVFKDAKLVIATSALYSNGERIEYEQIFPENKEWIYSQRKSSGNESEGNTWKYAKQGDFKQVISLNNPMSEQMVTPARLREDIASDLISHYYGRTSEGKYNDDTGQAYLISYYDDGTVKTLYQGRFQDGVFEDNSKTAWYITRNKENNTDYMYYEGIFRDGHPSEEKKDRVRFENPVTVETIEEKTKNQPFEQELSWDWNSIPTKEPEQE